MEGSLRVPFIARWPGRIAPGRVSNEIVHVTDLLPTLAAITGGTVPTDRPIDGIKQPSTAAWLAYIHSDTRLLLHLAHHPARRSRGFWRAGYPQV